MKYIKLLFYYLYSFFFCLRYLPWTQARRIPIIINPSVRIKNLYRGGIIIRGRMWRGMVSIGFEGTVGRCTQKSLVYISRGAHIVFNGYTCISKGCRLIVYQGTLTFGAKLTFNGDCFFSCYDDITLGNDMICGWNTSFITTNGHDVIVNGEERVRTAPINVGEHVWIGSDCVVGKGVSIADHSIVSHHSIVTSNLDTSHAIYGGYPAKLLKNDADWRA